VAAPPPSAPAAAGGAVHPAGGGAVYQPGGGGAVYQPGGGGGGGGVSGNMRERMANFNERPLPPLRPAFNRLEQYFMYYFYIWQGLRQSCGSGFIES
jgi:hypothetical protein